jgi:hypothetical protein
METCGRLFRNPVALIQFFKEHAAGTRGYPAAIKIDDDFLGEKACKGELVMTDCV